MIRNIFKIFYRSVLILAVALSPFLTNVLEIKAASNANTIQGLRSDLAKLQADKTAQENAIAQTQDEIDANKNAVISARNQQTKIKQDIAQAEIDIQLSEEKIIQTKAETEEILRFLQVSDNENALMNFIADAESSSDLIVRSAVVQQLTEYNEEQLKGLEELIKQNEQLKIDLDNKTKELDANIVTYNAAVTTLGDEMAAISDIYADIDTQIKSLEQSIAYWKTVCTSETQKLETCGVNVGYATGWLKPTTSGRITSMYGPRGGGDHTGIDIGGLPEGTPIYATAMGVVTAIWRQTSCGGNVVFINHNVNGKPYTTNYTHLLSINSSLKIGSMVTTQTQVGTLGGGSTKWYDKCTTGPHLHYQVNTGHYMGAGAYAYNSWSTYLVTDIQPPGFPTSTNIWWYSR